MAVLATSQIDSRPVVPTDVSAPPFAVARKGYAPDEVDEFVRQVSDRLNRLQGEVEWLRARCEHLERRSNTAQEAAYARLSRDFMDVVRRADEAASRVRSEAEAEARLAVGGAHREAARLLAAATEQAETILTQARAEAEHMLREGRAPPAAPPDAPRVPPQPVQMETRPMPEVRLSEMWAHAARSQSRDEASEDEDGLDLDLNASLFDIFEDPS